MFGRRCTLCGGKLDGRGICKECGLDNNKSDKNYMLNQSDCDNMPMTHVHKEQKQSYERADWSKSSKPKKERGRKKAERKRVNHNTMDRKRRKPGCLIFVIILVIALAELFLTIGGSDEIRYELKSQFENFFEDSDYGDYGYEELDPYEYLEAEIPAGGEAVTYTLPSGRYVAGVHIPAGYYTADVKDQFDVVQVTDTVNGIFLYEYSGKEETNYLDDLRIFPGAIVEINAQSTIILHSENAKTEEMTGMPNPLTETYTISDSEVKTAGNDFQSGVYDLDLVEGEGNVKIVIYDKNGEVYTERDFYFSESGSDGRSYKNMVFPDDSELTLEGEVEIRMTPSETIETTEYLGSYLYY